MTTARSARVRSSLTAHPLLFVALAAAVVGIGHAVWIWKVRAVGAFDADEAGYISDAFALRAGLGDLPGDAVPLARAFWGAGNGPLLPLLSVPLLWLGPDDPRTVMMALPLVIGMAAVAVAGIAGRLAGSGAALASGLVFLTLPTVITATQTYWLGSAAAASAALALWALLASERLTNRWTWAYGVAVGAMLISRSMTVGYLPAIAAAGLVVAWGERRSLLGLVRAAAAAVAVALPWWAVAHRGVLDYLTSYGYGERAGRFGSGSLPTRLRGRVDQILLGANVPLWLVLALVGAAAAAWLVARRRDVDGDADAPPGRRWPAATRPHLAVASFVVFGVMALASTTNRGVWFELPVVAALVALVVAVAARAPWYVRSPALAFVLVAGVLRFGAAWWMIPPEADGVPFLAPEHRVSQFEPGFALYDPRFSPLRRSEQDGAALEWALLSERVVAEVAPVVGDGDDAVVTLSGSFQLFNSNTVRLAGHLDGRVLRVTVPDTEVDEEVLAEQVTPEARRPNGSVIRGPGGRPLERVLVVAVHEHHLFTPDTEVDALLELARASGWQVVASVPIPDGGPSTSSGAPTAGGGEVLILRHPSGPVEGGGAP